MTLCQALCAANNQQGGTIHQFMGNQNWHSMQSAYYDIIKCGMTCDSKSAFDKLARQYHITINWKG